MRTHCAPGFQPHSWKNPRARDEFIQSLKEAAELHYVTRIRQSLPLLVQSGEEGKKLADNLNLYLKNYDMKKILTMLNQVNSKG